MAPLLPLGIAAGGLLFNELFKPGQTSMDASAFDYDADRRAQAGMDPDRRDRPVS